MKEMSNAASERAAAQAALRNGELKDRETYTAKQVAMRCGTDAKTMRKFFRSTFSTVEAVGQGGRYEFDAADMPKIKKEFHAWLTRRTVKRPKDASEIASKKAAAPPKPKIDPTQVQEVLNKHDDPDITLGQLADAIERAQEEDWDDDAEPTAEEMAELERMIEEGGI